MPEQNPDTSRDHKSEPSLEETIERLFVPERAQPGGPSDLAQSSSDSGSEATGVHFSAQNTSIETGHSPASGPRLPEITGYAIEGELGRGGMGVVYRALHLRLKRVVALKVIRGAGSDDEIVRFRAEAEVIAALQHPNIVQIYEVGEHAGGPFCALEFVNGGSLLASLAGQQLAPDAAAALIETIARAVHYAHQKGIVHRDLKPANVLMTADGVPKVTDFGLAKRLEGENSGLTRTGEIMGTPAYMAPEQARGETKVVGPSADIYALGAILYELLTGRPPFIGPTVMGTIQRVLHEEPVPPSRHAPRVPRDLETICLKCLAKEPRDRYASALGLAQDVERFRAGEPILGRREGLLRKLRRKASKRLAMLAVVFVALVATAAAFWALRESAASSQSAVAVRQFDDRLESLAWSDSDRDELELLANHLAQSRPAEGEAARRKLTTRVTLRIREVLQQPRITGEDMARVEAGVKWLAHRDMKTGSQLRSEMAGRFRDWQPLLDLVPPFANADSVFSPQTVRIDASGMHPFKAALPVVPTVLSSRGKVRMTVEFAGDWEAGSQLGVTIHHRNGTTPGNAGGGYSFTLVPTIAKVMGENEKPLHPTKSPTFRQTGRHAELRIDRNGAILQRRAVILPRGPARILAERDGSSLRAQVNDLPALTFIDPIPLTGDDETVFAIGWPGTATVVRLRLEGSALPPAASPLEKADDLYDRGKFADALALYQQQARSGGSFEAEARCKVGFCQAGLNRTEEAGRTFEQVMGMPGERWPVVAAAQLWLLRLREKQFADADAVFALVSVRFSRDQLAQYVPAAVREEIGRGQRIPMVNFLFPDAKLIPRMESMVRIAELLHLQDSADGHAGSLAIALALNRDYQRAIPQADRMLRTALAAFDPRVSRGEGPYWALRWACWTRRARGDTRGAAEVANRTISELASKPAKDSNVIANVRATIEPLRVEQSRCLARLGQWPEAEAAIDECLRDCPRPVVNYAFYCQVYLLKGFLLARKGDESGAQKAWKQGMYPAYLAQFPPEERPAERVPPGRWGLLDHWIMASLTDTLPDQDAAALATALFAQLSSDPLMNQLTSTLQSSPAIFRGTWRSPRGRELARRMAFMDIEPLDFFRLPPTALGYEKFRQDLFGGKPTDAQDEACWECMSRASKLMFAGKMSKTQLLQLGMAWKGNTGLFGWAGGSAAIPREERAYIAYLMGLRYLKLNKPNDARALFRKAVSEAEASSPIKVLLEGELKRLDVKK